MRGGGSPGTQQPAFKIGAGITSTWMIVFRDLRHIPLDPGSVGCQLFPLAAFFLLPSSGVSLKEFAVTVRPTEASERCRLRGPYTLRLGVSALELWSGPDPGTQLYDWPYRFLRRFGRDKVSEGLHWGRLRG